MNRDFHYNQNYQKINEYQFINNMFFGAKKKETTKVDDTTSKDLELVTKMNHDLAKSLDCLLYTSPSPRDAQLSRMPSSA